MRVLVCGSRHFDDEALMRAVMIDEGPRFPGDVLIHGDAKGADKLSEKFICSYVKVERYPADWNKHGKAAGPIRNKQMLEEGKPDLVIAFLAPNSKGTKNMIEQAEKTGIPVRIVEI